MGLSKAGVANRRLNRSFLAVVALFVVFFQAGNFAADQRWRSLSPLTWFPNARSALGLTQSTQNVEHPIPKLMADAEDKFRALLSAQSKTLQDAVAEYIRRYKRDPPKGFDDWWNFAVANNVKMIDEYDTLFEDLEPFWQLSGEELRRRVDQVGQLPSIDLVRIENGKAIALHAQKDFVDAEASARANGFRRMIERFREKLPNMDFPINGKAEGRVVIPWEHKRFANLTVQDTSRMCIPISTSLWTALISDTTTLQTPSAGVEAVLGSGFTADWRGDGNVWESWRRVCDPKSQARRLFASIRSNSLSSRAVNRLEPRGLPAAAPAIPSEDFTFRSAVDSEYDFCKNPWAHYQQGHFFSDWRTISVLYPVFSPAKASGFSDVRIPSHYYHQATPGYTYGWDQVNLVAKEYDDMEIAWENKSDVIFWRGSTTGGGNTPSGFAAQYQRHRFVRMTSDISANNPTVVFPAPPNAPSDYIVAKVPIDELNRDITDIAFVKLTGYSNYPGGRAALRKQHRFDKSVPLGEHWKYKYLVDIDGMAYSGRFFAFLASDSVPVKATVYTEFYSGWIQPWLHYIPLSQSYQELYNIYAFFSGPSRSMLMAANETSYPPLLPKGSDGDRRLRRIARAGKQWKKTIGRPVDMEAYVYRLALEWARLWSDDREAIRFILPEESRSLA